MIHSRMAYCGPRGIPYRRFVGGPDVWDRLSRFLALSWDRHEREKCPGCGVHPDVWDESRGGDRDAMKAVSHLCRGDELIATEREEIKDRGPGWRVGLAYRQMIIEREEAD